MIRPRKHRQAHINPKARSRERSASTISAPGIGTAKNGSDDSITWLGGRCRPLFFIRPIPREADSFSQPRYVSQLLYGCQDPLCRTPTCLSCQRRVSQHSGKPLRRMTPLSARAVACVLATEEDPESRLCRNTQAVAFELELQGDTRRRRRAFSTEENSSTHSRFEGRTGHNRSLSGPSTHLHEEIENNHARDGEHPDDGLIDSVQGNLGPNEGTHTGIREEKKKPKGKEPKSFTQAL